VQWTADEQIAAHIVTNEVHFYAGNAVGAERTTKLRLEGTHTRNPPAACVGLLVCFLDQSSSGMHFQTTKMHAPKTSTGCSIALRDHNNLICFFLTRDCSRGQA